MTSEAHLTYRWYQAMSVFWAGYIWLGRVRPCHSSVLQGTLSMLQHYHCAYQATDSPWQSLFHGFVSNLCSAVIPPLDPPKFHPPTWLLCPDLCSAGLFCMHAKPHWWLHRPWNVFLIHCKGSAWSNIFLGLPQFLPSAADLLYSLDHPLHCAIIYNPRLVL